VTDCFPNKPEEVLVGKCGTSASKLYEEQVLNIQKRIQEDYDMDIFTVKNLHDFISSLLLNNLNKSRRMNI
jgi:hypothetical protein